VLQNNEVHGIGNTNGIIYFNNVGGTNLITGNTISGDLSGSTKAFGIYFAGNPASGTTSVTKNRLHTLKTSGSSGIAGIRDNMVGGTLNISNNFIGGGFVSTSTSNYFLLELLGAASRNIVHNTLVLNTIAGNPFDAANLYIQEGSTGFQNNIVINNFDDASSNCIYNNLLAPSDLTTNYNDLYAPGTNNSIGFDGVSSYDPLSNWQAAFSPNFPDVNSISAAVTFVNSATDFHLSGGSNGDAQLQGLNSLSSDDIDGDTRLTSPNGPYMGADEASTPLPVQMTGLFAAISGLEVELSWSTQSEVNNYGFEVERKSVSSYGLRVPSSQPETRNPEPGTTWSKVGFVEGFGTSTSPRSYSYHESLPGAGRYAYRLRQIDRDGTSRLTESMEIETAVSLSSSLQTYPNPFNPVTRVRFTVGEQGRARVSVFNIIGERIAVLFDKAVEPATRYEIPFDASLLPSGVYILHLEERSQRQSMKLLLAR